jgi:hypothetical protein
MANVRKRNLSIADKICLAAVEVLGREYAEPAFRLAHNVSTTNQQSFNVQLSRWLNTDKAKEFRKDVRNKFAKVATTEGADLRTREGVIDQLVTSVSQTQGKDAISGLTTLAKLQGFDKPTEEADRQERRTYFLPWVSNCRTCELMKIYLKTQKKG